jgi:hypothetical protein
LPRRLELPVLRPSAAWPRTAAGREGPAWPGGRGLTQVGLEDGKRCQVVELDAGRVGHPGEVVKHRDHTDRRLDLLIVESLAECVAHGLPGKRPWLRGQRRRELGEDARTRLQRLVFSAEKG